jgi:hypothetical protein
MAAPYLSSICITLKKGTDTQDVQDIHDYNCRIVMHVGGVIVAAGL